MLYVHRTPVDSIPAACFSVNIPSEQPSIKVETGGKRNDSRERVPVGDSGEKLECGRLKRS